MAQTTSQLETNAAKQSRDRSMLNKAFTDRADAEAFIDKHQRDSTNQSIIYLRHIKGLQSQ